MEGLGSSRAFGWGGGCSDAKKRHPISRSLRAKVTPTGVSPTVDHTALAASVARAVLAAQTASRTERLDSRAFSMFDKFRSERTRWHDWTLERER